MNIAKTLKQQFSISDTFGPRITALIVMCHGIFIVVFSLIDQLAVHRHVRLNDLSLDISLGVGLTLIYISALLARRKRTAWVAAAIAYIFYLGANIEGLTDEMQSRHHHIVLIILRALLLPLAILLLLIVSRRKYVVRSDAQGFRAAFALSLIILGVTLVYGTLGFYVLGPSGFHQKLSVPAAMHYSVDQLNITTKHPIHPYDDRAKLFADSLSFISIFAILYVLISFFQPLKARFGDQRVQRLKFHELLRGQHDACSEDFFKLWPHDKQYFFDSTGTSGLAFHVYRGVALIIGGPAGKQARFKQLLSEFQYVCTGNDWRPAIIHADETLREVYLELGYQVQKLGEEAVLDLNSFNSSTTKDKYFRNIINRFNKQNYSFDLLSPPHTEIVVSRVKEVSDQWKSKGNHSERGFVMGYYTNDYIEHCQLAVARDGAGIIQGFLNLVPADFDEEEATYDMLRSSNSALGNVNDYLLINLCLALHESGYKRLNLGLCPLVGLEGEERKGLIGSVMGFAYANGDRFYSFSGLYKFKNKYQPDWRPRFIVFQGGVRGFSRTMNALVRTMTSTAKMHVRSKY